MQVVLLPIKGEGLEFGFALLVADLQLGSGIESLGHIWQRHAILRTLRPSQAGYHRRHIQSQGTGEHRFVARIAPHALHFGIGFHQRDLLIAAAAQLHIPQRHFVHREEATGRTKLR
ncbi:hypothetical protein D3C81_1263610 [compost metagenome]